MASAPIRVIAVAVAFTSVLFCGPSIQKADAGILQFLTGRIFRTSFSPSHTRRVHARRLAKRTCSRSFAALHSFPKDVDKITTVSHQKNLSSSGMVTQAGLTTAANSGHLPTIALPLLQGQSGRKHLIVTSDATPITSRIIFLKPEIPAVKPIAQVVKINPPMRLSVNNHQLATLPPPSNDSAFSTRASWYGPGFQGRKTASGQIFNQYGMTAASRTLRLGSKVLVANPSTGRCCTVTINDRGPYVNGRDIDLSRGAAAKIGVTGVSPVVCVAYAESGTGTIHASSRPPKINSKVMHLIADVQ